jgi:sugar porter (SP) family MFS transporter
VVPAAAFLLLLFRVPESPRWLITKKGLVEEGREILRIINPTSFDRDVTAILTSQAEEGAAGESLFTRKHIGPVLLAVLFAVFNQVSGINAILYYAPRIFEMTGLGTSSALLSSAGLGLINFAFTLLAMNFIDRFGRRKLMLIGSFGLIATLGLVARSFYTEQFTGFTVPILLFVYIAFFAFSQGAVIWVFISEIFPNSVRAKGQALGSSMHWIMATIIAFTFPYFAEHLGGGHTFLFFCLMMVLQLVFVWRFMPETKGTSLEQVEKILVVH